jgi:hypothetical protein
MYTDMDYKFELGWQKLKEEENFLYIVSAALMENGCILGNILQFFDARKVST